MTTLPNSIIDSQSRLAGTTLRNRRAPAGTGGGPGASMTTAVKPNKPVKVSSASRLTAADLALVSEILSEEIDFMANGEFSKAGAERRIYNHPISVPRPDVAWYRPMMDDIGTAAPRRHQGVVLTAAQERVIFTQFNYAKYRMRKVQKALRGKPPTTEQSRELLKWYRTAHAYREQIAETNLALVLAMAKRVRIGENEFADLIGEGNMALMRSVDKFDCLRGFKFSTYACRAILKAFSRHGIKIAKHRQRFPVEFDPAWEQGDGSATIRANSEKQDAAELKQIVETNQAQLTELERAVVMHRFALEGSDMGRQPTLAQVGRLVGLTKERVRQIQNQALEKIRMALEGCMSHPLVAPSTPRLIHN